MDGIYARQKVGGVLIETQGGEMWVDGVNVKTGKRKAFYTWRVFVLAVVFVAGYMLGNA